MRRAKQLADSEVHASAGALPAAHLRLASNARCPPRASPAPRTMTPPRAENKLDSSLHNFAVDHSKEMLWELEATLLKEEGCVKSAAL